MLVQGPWGNLNSTRNLFTPTSYKPSLLVTGPLGTRAALATCGASCGSQRVQRWKLLGEDWVSSAAHRSPRARPRLGSAAGTPDVDGTFLLRKAGCAGGEGSRADLARGALRASGSRAFPRPSRGWVPSASSLPLLPSQDGLHFPSLAGGEEGAALWHLPR